MDTSNIVLWVSVCDRNMNVKNIDTIPYDTVRYLTKQSGVPLPSVRTNYGKSSLRFRGTSTDVETDVEQFTPVIVRP